MDYRTASSVPATAFEHNGRAHFEAPLHAYFNGTTTTICGLALLTEAYMHTTTKWEDRPRDLQVCEMCAAEASASAWVDYASQNRPAQV